MDGQAHRVVGGLVGGAAYMLCCKAFDLHPTLPGLAVSVGVGVAGASLHDMVEPGTHPNHRDFFHSVVLNGLLAVSVRRGCLSPAIAPERKILLAVAGLACLSHPCLDAFTPKGLPIL